MHFDQSVGSDCDLETLVDMFESCRLTLPVPIMDSSKGVGETDNFFSFEHTLGSVNLCMMNGKNGANKYQGLQKVCHLSDVHEQNPDID